MARAYPIYAWNEGREAFHLGLPASANPYPKNKPGVSNKPWHAWQEGWRDSNWRQEKAD